MVNLEIPSNYTNSPSSFNGTPHLTINKDINHDDLDSSNAFEGPEKLLEVWFAPSEKALPLAAAPLGLKAVTQDTWKQMLELVNCKVLSVMESRNVDAYLLSESSMFIFPHKLVLKTCGTTTLLYGLPKILELAGLEAGFPYVKSALSMASHVSATPYRVFYSRKNYLFPDQQQGPHRSWRDEVRYLDRMFVGGSAYMIGKMNGEHWYLYITGPGTQLTPPATPPKVHVNHSVGISAASDKEKNPTGVSYNEGDETLEILMTDLEPNNARQFYVEDACITAQNHAARAQIARKHAIEHLGALLERDNTSDINRDHMADQDDSTFDVFLQTSTEHQTSWPDFVVDDAKFAVELNTEGHALGTVVTETCGLAKLYPTTQYPDARIDSYLFTPCGYSANGVVPNPDCADSTHYWTVHVTPEPQCSYASFETNVPTRNTGQNSTDILQKVVNIFKPGRFSVTLFEGKSDDEKFVARKSENENAKLLNFVPGYRRVDRIVHDLEGYELVFRYFERDDWKGGAPRLGEYGL